MLGAQNSVQTTKQTPQTLPFHNAFRALFNIRERHKDETFQLQHWILLSMHSAKTASREVFKPEHVWLKRSKLLALIQRFWYVVERDMYVAALQGFLLQNWRWSLLVLDSAVSLSVDRGSGVRSKLCKKEYPSLLDKMRALGTLNHLDLDENNCYYNKCQATI